MKLTVFAFLLVLLAASAQNPLSAQGSASGLRSAVPADPDMPTGAGAIDKLEYLRLRSEHIGTLRGLPYPQGDNPRLRALRTLDAQLKTARRTTTMNVASSTWTPLGPAPIPNGQTAGFSLPVSGRVTAIVIHPVHPDTVYVGTAQGGVYRSFDGGATWTAIFDNAATLAIGALALDPLNPTVLFVGTGEANLSLDSFFGVGLYIVKNIETSPALYGPYNLDDASHNVLAQRGISKILVDPSDDNTVYVATSSGQSGASGDPHPDRPQRGLYRSRNAMSASPTFTWLDIGAGANPIITDAVLDPGDHNSIVCAVLGQSVFGIAGGLYYTTDALSPTPTFFESFALDDGINVKFAIVKVGAAVTAYAATGEGGEGVLRKSTDGGHSWSGQLSDAFGFCYPQCWYDIAVGVDPANANRVYVCGSSSGYGGGSTEFKRSVNGGVTFSDSYDGLHADMHAIAIASPPYTNIIYVGNDGGVFRSDDFGVNWNSINTSGFSATQFGSIALHPTDRNFTIGGTQDNGTNFYSSSGEWMLSAGGDGGFTLIDRNASDTDHVTMYHTFYNASVGNSQLIGFQVATSSNNWTGFYGCGGTPNGIECTDTVLFYAPMALGPGDPNTVYFGTNVLYRSADRGATMPEVSQHPLGSGAPVSAIGISPQDDNIRIVGLSDGGVYATNTGSSTLTDITGGLPPHFIARAVIDPGNSAMAYVTLDGYGPQASPLKHVWKTASLMSGIWTAVSDGIPDVPVNAFAIDPMNTNDLYCGTDIGVYYSSDAGVNWSPFGSGLPRVAVFDMAIQSPNRILRIATHGRGMWEIPTAFQNVASVESVAVGLGANWNLVSLPVSPSGHAVRDNFPGASGPAFAYSNSYVATSTMSEGSGYWLKFPAGRTDTISGTRLSSLSLTVTQGWNLVGSISRPFPVDSITSTPAGLIASKFFGYQGSYVVENTITPGSAHWVRVNQSGSLTLGAGSAGSGGALRIVETSERPPAPPSDATDLSTAPAVFGLGQNYPNPFNPRTHVRFSIAILQPVTLRVFDVLGQEVATLVNEVKEPGEYSVEWDAGDRPSGVYYYRLSAGSFVETKKLLLMR